MSRLWGSWILSIKAFVIDSWSFKEISARAEGRSIPRLKLMAFSSATAEVFLSRAHTSPLPFLIWKSSFLDSFAWRLWRNLFVRKNSSASRKPRDSKRCSEEDYIIPCRYILTMFSSPTLSGDARGFRVSELFLHKQPGTRCFCHIVNCYKSNLTRTLIISASAGTFRRKAFRSTAEARHMHYLVQTIERKSFNSSPTIDLEREEKWSCFRLSRQFFNTLAPCGRKTSSVERKSKCFS